MMVFGENSLVDRRGGEGWNGGLVLFFVFFVGFKFLT